jgi:hypothetical protein
MSQPQTIAASVRLAIVRGDGVHSELEQGRMRTAALELADVQSSETQHTASWRSANPGVVAEVVIDHDLSNDDMACAYFTGPDRVILATQLVSILNYMPVELLHLVARSDAPAAQRRNALSVLAQVYVAADGEWHWDHDIETTVAAARADPAAGVRREALSTEIQGNPAAAAAHLREESAGIVDAGEREHLVALGALAGRAAAEFAGAPPIPAGSLHLGGAHLAVPIFRVGATANVIQRLTGIAEVVSARTVEAADGGGEVTELRATGLDATLTYVTSKQSPVGCAYFSGDDRVTLAAGIAWALQYFPIHLAKLTASFGQLSEVRALGLLALAFASSKRMDPDVDIDPAVPGILAAALRDDDPAVRSMAAGVQWLLTGEVGRG